MAHGSKMSFGIMATCCYRLCCGQALGVPIQQARQQANMRPEQVKWRRVILDEAHSIKDRRCSTARAVFGLTSKYKWALSGTPLQACAAPCKSIFTSQDGMGKAGGQAYEKLWLKHVWRYMQNRVGELYSLIRFLRIFPYAFYFCFWGHAKSAPKGRTPCECRSLDFPFKRCHRQCDHCGCAPVPPAVAPAPG